MHILILADPVDKQKAGIHVYTKKLIEHLLKIDKKNQYTFVHRQKNNFFEGKNHIIISRRKIPGYASFRRHFLIPRLAQKLQVDLVFEPCHIMPLNLPKNIKKVVTIHDLTPILFPKFHPLRSRLIHRLLLKKIIRAADLILTPSETTKHDIQNYCDTKAKIVVTPLGVDQEKFANKNESPAPDFPKNPYFLYLGTIEPRKNLGILIEAFWELKKEKNLPHSLILAGEIGWKSSALIKKIRKSKDVILLGHISEKDKTNFLKNADLFIYPSFYEGFGLPVLEAMSYKKAVICSTGGSLGEIFKNYALTFNPKNKEELKTAIKKLVENSNFKKKLIQKSYNFSQKFNWKNTAIATLKTFEQILTKQKWK